jgi:hypothetical protein
LALFTRKFNIISLYYVNSWFGFGSWYRKDFAHWHHVQAGPEICSTSCTLASKGTKCPFTSITPLRLTMHAAPHPLCHTLQRQLYFFYTIYILLLCMNTAIIKQFLTWVIPSLCTVSYISNKLPVNLSASTVLSRKKDNYILWFHTTRLAITTSNNKCTQYNTIKYKS